MEIYMMNNREPFNKMETLHGEFYENALKYPERIAFICVACSKLYVAKRSKEE